MSTNQKGFFLGVFVGASVATLSTLLFTTKKGKQLQSKIGGLCEDAEESLKDAFFKTKDEIKDVVDDAKDSAEHLGKKLAHKVKA